MLNSYYIYRLYLHVIYLFIYSRNIEYIFPNVMLTSKRVELIAYNTGFTFTQTNYILIINNTAYI